MGMNIQRFTDTTRCIKWYHLLWGLLGSIAISLLLTLAGCSTVPTITHGVPNFAQVSYGIYRGGQPTIEGWQYLKSLGVTNVVKLNEISEGSDQPAIDLGMTVCYHPINFADQAVLKPNKKDFLEAVSQIVPGTYVHCEHGQDRTGLCIGAWQVLIEHVDKNIAYKEILAHDFHKILHGLNDFWEDDIPNKVGDIP